MLHHTRLLSLLLCVTGLSACTTDNPTVYTNYQPYTYDSSQIYPEGYVSNAYPAVPQDNKEVVVPDTYHVSATHAPTPHADMDREWVNSQNARGYTIELADDDKAYHVAGTLYKAPKSERTAEVKYQRDGKTYYKGLYGSYPNYEEAQKALSTLPADVKQNAGIKTWSSVQSGVNE